MQNDFFKPKCSVAENHCTGWSVYNFAAAHIICISFKSSENRHCKVGRAFCLNLCGYWPTRDGAIMQTACWTMNIGKRWPEEVRKRWRIFSTSANQLLQTLPGDLTLNLLIRYSNWLRSPAGFTSSCKVSLLALWTWSFSLRICSCMSNLNSVGSMMCAEVSFQTRFF